MGATLHLIVGIGLLLIGLPNWLPFKRLEYLLSFLFLSVFALSGIAVFSRRPWSWWTALLLQIPLGGGLGWMALQVLNTVAWGVKYGIRDVFMLASWVILVLIGSLSMLSLVMFFFLLRRRVRECYGIFPHQSLQISRGFVVGLAAVLGLAAAGFVPAKRYVANLGFWSAVSSWDVPGIRLWLRAGADPQQLDPQHGVLALANAIRWDQPEVVDALLEGGANPNGGGSWLGCPLSEAVLLKNSQYVGRRGRSRLNPNRYVALLLKHGADPNLFYPGNMTALESTASNDNFEAAALLLKGGADPNLPNSSGGTPLMAASRYGKPRIVQLLVQSKRLRARGKKLVLPLFRAALGEDVTVVRRLLAQGADPNAADPGGFSALMGAAAQGNVPVVKALVDAGARVDAADAWGGTPRRWAAVRNQFKVVQLLADHRPEGTSAKILVPNLPGHPIWLRQRLPTSKTH